MAVYRRLQHRRTSAAAEALTEATSALQRYRWRACSLVEAHRQRDADGSSYRWSAHIVLVATGQARPRWCGRT